MIYRVLVWSLIVFACFYGLGAYPLLDNNEGMYAAIAKDMLHSGDFIIPHLNGVPYIEKPPLLYWLMAASMTIFGENAFAAHLIPALALFATVWKIHRFLLRVTGSQAAGITAALIFATSLPLIAMARMVLCDMLMTCFLSAALIFFYEWDELRHCEERSDAAIQLKRHGRDINPFCAADAASGLLRPRGLAMTEYGFYACVAFAVLAKGFVAIILAGGTIAVFLLWQRRPFGDWLKPLSPVGILLFLCIVTPWHIAASLKEPGFAYFYFINEHLLRFLGMREPHDYYTGPFWYYLPRILIYLLPWTGLLPAAVAEVRGQRLDVRKNSSLMSNVRPLTSFLLSWFLFFLVFFSASGGKANYYMIAGMPPLVMLLALRIQNAIGAKNRLLPLLASLSLLPIAIAVIAVPSFCHPGTGDFYPACTGMNEIITGCMGLFFLVAIALCWLIPQRWTILLVASIVLPLLPTLIMGIAQTGDRISQKPVAEYLDTLGGRAAIYQEFESLSALAFYLDKPLVIVDSQSSDLLYGKRRSAAPGEFISLAEWIGHSPLPMVVLNKRVSSVMTASPNLCVMRRFERVSVIRKCDK